MAQLDLMAPTGGTPRTMAAMERPTRFEHHRFVGDKRTQVVYDIDAITSEQEHVIDELMAAETYLCFGPDELFEARNRGYRLWRPQRAALEASEA